MDSISVCLFVYLFVCRSFGRQWPFIIIFNVVVSLNCCCYCCCFFFVFVNWIQNFFFHLISGCWFSYLKKTKKTEFHSFFNHNHSMRILDVFSFFVSDSWNVCLYVKKIWISFRFIHQQEKEKKKSNVNKLIEIRFSHFIDKKLSSFFFSWIQQAFFVFNLIGFAFASFVLPGTLKRLFFYTFFLFYIRNSLFLSIILHAIFSISFLYLFPFYFFTFLFVCWFFIFY